MLGFGAALDLIEMDYRGGLEAWCRTAVVGLDGVEQYDRRSVQAAVGTWRGVRFGVVRGTDPLDPFDWIANLRFLPATEVSGGARWWWHRGFLSVARRAWGFFRGRGVEVLVGHSQGAAAAACCAVSLGVPAVCFAQPRCAWGVNPDRDGLVRTINRSDDPINSVPPWWAGYRWVGSVELRRPEVRGGLSLASRHGVAAYRALLGPSGE